MQKILMIAITAMILASCGNGSNQNVSSVDSTYTDSIATDSITVADSTFIIVDSAQ
jgi:hypothetical protein